jgi:hypothetical protein
MPENGAFAGRGLRSVSTVSNRFAYARSVS